MNENIKKGKEFPHLDSQNADIEKDFSAVSRELESAWASSAEGRWEEQGRRVVHRSNFNSLLII